MMIRSSNPALFEDSPSYMKPCLEGVGAVNFNRHIRHTSLSLSYIVKFILASMT